MRVITAYLYVDRIIPHLAPDRLAVVSVSLLMTYRTTNRLRDKLVFRWCELSLDELSYKFGTTEVNRIVGSLCRVHCEVSRDASDKCKIETVILQKENYNGSNATSGL